MYVNVANEKQRHLSLCPVVNKNLTSMDDQNCNVSEVCRAKGLLHICSMDI
jgi:hypothetical protein